MTELAPSYRELLRRHLVAETVFDMEGTLVTLTEDCIFEDVATGQRYQGREAVRGYYKEWWEAFGVTPVDIRSSIVSEESLIVETRFVGTHRAPYGGLAATGNSISLPVAIFISLRDGLMAGERFYYDRYSLLSQITPA
jgi:steroid delta-isomerase-like uncharacterized protein